MSERGTEHMKDAIFHNPHCSKSRATLKLLGERGVDVPVVEYLKEPPDAATLKNVCALLGMRPYDLVRRKEALFGELKLGSVKPDDDARWFKVLAANPALIERPIVVYKGKAALGRPPETVLKILS
jgi:arsenate reductase (glutaredoxin)